MSTVSRLRKLIFTSCLLFTTQASSLEVEEAFHMLEKVPADYFAFGSVCEQLARVQMYKTFPKEKFFVESGIVYTNHLGSTLGELDIVVFDRESRQAVLIGEVKCWKNLSKAMKKARMQLARFADAIKTGRRIKLYHAYDDNRKYSASQFKKQMRSLFISQNGGREFGFQMSIGLNHEQVTQLRSVLLKCQKARKCPYAGKPPRRN